MNVPRLIKMEESFVKFCAASLETRINDNHVFCYVILNSHNDCRSFLSQTFTFKILLLLPEFAL